MKDCNFVFKKTLKAMWYTCFITYTLIKFKLKIGHEKRWRLEKTFQVVSWQWFSIITCWVKKFLSENSKLLTCIITNQHKGYSSESETTATYCRFHAPRFWAFGRGIPLLWVFWRVSLFARFPKHTAFIWLLRVFSRGPLAVGHPATRFCNDPRYL